MRREMNVPDTIPTDSLMRYLGATPEERHVIDRFLRKRHEKRLRTDPESQHAGAESSPAPEPAPGDPPGGVIRAQMEELKAELWKVAEAIKHSVGPQPPVNQSEAERIFAVLQRLRTKRAGMMAPLYDVFVATVLEGRSQKAAAESCDCSPALLSKRVGELEKEFGLPLKQLQNYAQPLLEMETSVRGQRYARKRSAPPVDESGQYDEGDSQTAAEDDNGYLREERPDDS